MNDNYMSIEEMAEATLSELTEDDKNYIIALGEAERLNLLHQTTGRYIRNQFSLWERPHEPQYDDEDVDISTDHPDALSMQVIETMYEMLTTEDEEE